MPTEECKATFYSGRAGSAPTGSAWTSDPRGRSQSVATLAQLRNLACPPGLPSRHFAAQSAAVQRHGAGL
jgi:hypothetical protein